MTWTAEELEEMRQADEEIERDFALTQEDLVRSRAMDREAVLQRMEALGKLSAALLGA